MLSERLDNSSIGDILRDPWWEVVEFEDDYRDKIDYNHPVVQALIKDLDDIINGREETALMKISLHPRKVYTPNEMYDIYLVFIMN